MKTLQVSPLLLALFCAPSVPADAGTPTITAYAVTLSASAEGRGVATARLTIEGAIPGTMSVPFGFPGVTTVRLDGAPSGVAAEAHPVNGQSTVTLALPDGVPPSFGLTLTAEVPEPFQRTEPAPGERRTLPEGTLVFRHALVNADRASIGRYRLEVIFPDGYRAHAVREALPKLKKNEAGPRARLADIGDRSGAWLEAAALNQGDSASLQIELVPAGRSPIWLVAGLLLSGLYLVSFRDLVSRRAP